MRYIVIQFIVNVSMWPHRNTLNNTIFHTDFFRQIDSVNYINGIKCLICN